MNILAIGMGHFGNIGKNKAKMAKWAKNRQNQEPHGLNPRLYNEFIPYDFIASCSDHAV